MGTPTAPVATTTDPRLRYARRLRHGRWLMTICLLPVLACTAEEPVSPLARAVFGDLAPRIAAHDRTDVLTELGFSLSEDGITLLDPACGRPMDTPEIRLEDLNGDGDPELSVNGGNTCLAGGTGAVLLIFSRNQDSRYRPVLNVIALGYQITGERIDGWPDLLLGGPGFCHPVWRWNGARYDFHHAQAEEPGGCDHRW
ncbi:MAG: hypothetical protein AB7I04_05270 [Pseudomonadales bacterium]